MAQVEPKRPVEQREADARPDQRACSAKRSAGAIGLPGVDERDRAEPATQRRDVELGRPERLAPVARRTRIPAPWPARRAGTPTAGASGSWRRPP